VSNYKPLAYCIVPFLPQVRKVVAAQMRDAVAWPIQEIFLFLGLCARINTILCARTFCSGSPPHPLIAHTIAQYHVSP